MIVEAIKKVVEGKHLTEEEMVGAFDAIMSGEATPAQIGCFLTALRLKGETEEEITGAAKVMRAKAEKVNAGEDVVDTCGTGGDGAGTFNISTASALVTAGAGVKVAKHGNRAASSKCGSADVLIALGVKVDADPQVVEKCIKEAGIGFMFAPRMHSAMKHAIGPRREIGIRTVFNVLGPLTNPAGAKRQVMGVFSPAFTALLARVLGRLGSKHAMVVHGSDGIDEITLTGPTHVAEFKDGELKEYVLNPVEFGFALCSPSELKGGDAEQNARIVREVLKGKKGPARDITLLNAGAAIMVSGKVSSLKEGIEAAMESIESGRAEKALQALVEISNAGE